MSKHDRALTFASWTGTAPLDASSGQQIRHRLSRDGNRRMNHVLHFAAPVQLRNATEGRAYFDKKVAAGKTSMEALRALKRRLSDVVDRQFVADAVPPENTDVGAGPGGHCGASEDSSAADLPPHIGTSDQPLPGPAHPTLPAPDPRDHPLPVPTAAPRRRAGAVKVERPHRTNDLDGDQRRRTLESDGTGGLDTEGNQKRMF